MTEVSKLSLKEVKVNILDPGNQVSLAATQLCLCREKQAIDNL